MSSSGYDRLHAHIGELVADIARLMLFCDSEWKIKLVKIARFLINDDMWVAETD